jgi:sigma-B regulation protein RsbU (phosphoserine phosphatase)
LYRGSDFKELSSGGLILGPNPHARYERGYEMLNPGSVLLLYTDGIIEAENQSGETFGTERLKEIISSRKWTVARELVEGVFADVNEFSASDRPVDDQTVVAVIRNT